MLKQMRLINHGGFSKTERKQWRVVIFGNLISAFQVLLSAMSDHEIDFQNADNIVSWTLHVYHSLCTAFNVP